MRAALARAVGGKARRGASTYEVLPPPPSPPLSTRRVVVTGVGLVTPLGVGVDHVWRRVLAGECGVRALGDDKFAELPVRIAAAVPRGGGEGDFATDMWIDKADTRTQGPDYIAFAMSAAAQAVRGSGLDTYEALDRDRVGVAVGSGIGGIEETADTGAQLAAGQLRRVTPFFVPRILVNMPAGHISMKYGFRGPNHAVSTACTTGAHALGDAFRFIRNGDADAMVAGGTEASVNVVSVAGFSRARALASNFNDDPGAASRPFDAQRSGFVLGEGAGCVVLEELEHARARGAPILAEIRGYGLSGDAHHITAPKEDGSGSLLCMRAALRDAGLSADHVDYVNAHATSTPVGDVVEARGLRALCRDVQGAGPAVSSTKGALGHLLGAAGAVEAIMCILAVRDNMVPPTVNLTDPDPDTDGVHLVGHGAGIQRQVRVAMSNSFGFGGTNCSIVLTEPPGDAL